MSALPASRRSPPRSTSSLRIRVRRLERANRELVVALCVLLALVVPGLGVVLVTWAACYLLWRIARALVALRTDDRIRRRRGRRDLRRTHAAREVPGGEGQSA